MAGITRLHHRLLIIQSDVRKGLCGQVLIGLFARLPLRIEGAAAAVAAAPTTAPAAGAAAAITAAALWGSGSTEELGSPVAQQHHLLQFGVVVHGG